jgi:hypothetical protein
VPDCRILANFPPPRHPGYTRGMSIVLPAVAVAAFCVSLCVRIVNRRERWAKWTAVGLASLPLLYVLSFGPACWFSAPSTIGLNAPAQNRFAYSENRAIVLSGFYLPIGWIASRSDSAARALNRFGHAGVSTIPIFVPISGNGRATFLLEDNRRP